MNVRQVVPRDAIPSVDDPTFADDYFGAPADEVIVLEAGEEAPRAYPVRILNYHEIANDDVDGRPVAVTWCPLCGSAVVYDRTVDGSGTSGGPAGDDTDDLVLTFGVSGKLADDDLVMYDRETGSEWKQSLGECIAGPLEGTTLHVLPATVTTWERFREDHPDGVVLARPGGESEAASATDDPAPIDYERDPYGGYFAAEGFGLDAHRGTGEGRAWDRDDLDPKAVVLGVEARALDRGGHGDDAGWNERGDRTGGSDEVDEGHAPGGSEGIDEDYRGASALGFPLPWVRDAGGVATATVGGTGVVVFATPDGIHAFADPGLDFRAVGDGRFRADGTVWDGATGRSEDGRALPRLPARRLFAFTWRDDHGPDAFVSI